MDNQKNIDTIARNCIAVRLRLLNRVVTNLYDDALRPLGLKVSQLNLLVVTAKLGLAQPAKVCDILQWAAARGQARLVELRGCPGRCSGGGPVSQDTHMAPILVRAQ